MISKELLQQVVKNLTVKEIVSTDNNKIDNNIYYNVEEIGILQAINKYELESMLKEWAIKQKYGGDFFVLEIISGHLKGNSYALVEYRIYSEYIKNGEEDFKKAITTGTELENVIDICEWILKQKDNYVK